MALASSPARPAPPTRPETSRGRLPGPGALLAAGAVLVAAALGVSDGNYDPWALGLVTAATTLCAAALFAPRAPAAAPSPPDRLARWVLGFGLLGAFAFDALVLPGMTVDPARLAGFRPVLTLAALLAATHLWRGAPCWLERLRWPAVAVCWVALAAIVIRAAPSPGIDVWTLQQAGAHALSNGLDPYALAYRNPYGPGTALLGREILSPDGTRILAYPYSPLVLLFGLPAALLGDVRVAYVAATVAAAWLVRELGGRSHRAELAASLLLFQPRTLVVMEASWTEPLVLLAVCAVALLARRARAVPGGAGGPVALGIAAGLALASKQYAPLLVLPFLFATPRAARWRAIAVAGAVAAAVLLPFLAWDPAGLWRGLVTFQLAQPFREDALSWPAALVAAGGPQLPAWPAFLVAGAVLVAAARRVRSVSDALAAGTLAWLALVLANKQAFCNYYWLAVGLLCAAAAADVGPSGEDRAADT